MLWGGTAGDGIRLQFRAGSGMMTFGELGMVEAPTGENRSVVERTWQYLGCSDRP